MLEWLERLPTSSLILAAVSGGADSVYLTLFLHALREKGNFRLEIVHVNHRTRGIESDADESFVRALAEELDVPFHVERIDPERVLSARKTIDEGSLRARRLGLLKETAKRIGAQCIAFGHHRDDLAETFLLNALRGSGPAGLEGMRVWRELPGGIVFLRPLLHLRRSVIEDELIRSGRTWCTDSTNSSTIYRRNALRIDVMPMLERLESAAVENLATSAEFCGEILAVYTEVVAAAHQRTLLADGPQALLLSTPRLREEMKTGLAYGILRHAFLTLCEDHNASATTPLLPLRERMRDAIARLRRESGEEAEFRIGTGVELILTNRFALMFGNISYVEAAVQVRTGFPFLLLGPDERTNWTPPAQSRAFQIDYIDLPPYSFEAIPQERDHSPNEYRTVEDDYHCYLDADAIEGPLSLRSVDPAEKLDMPGGIGKVARDCLKESAVPPRLRHMVLGIHDDRGLIWIPGVRRTNRAWVNEETRRVLEIRFCGRSSFPAIGTKQ